MTDFDVLIIVVALVWIGSGIAAFRRWMTAPWRTKSINLGKGNGWGTLYAFKDKAQPRLIKVGTTRRMSMTRKGEVSTTMVDGGALSQIFAIDMPFARAAETQAHRRLRGYRSKVPGRGQEWFMAGYNGEYEHIVKAMKEAAWDVRKAAVAAGRWEPWMDQQAQTIRFCRGQIVKEQIFR